MHYDVRNSIEQNGVIEISDYWIFDYLKQFLGDKNDEISPLKSIKKNSRRDSASRMN